jgi:hypothetical protein
MPPVEAQAPIEITYLGLGICSYSCLIIGAILTESRPATIIRSACLGDGLMTSMPNRARSYRDAKVDIISMAQQARPNPNGQIDDLRDQLTAFSTVVNIIPSGKYLSIPIGGLLS